MNRPVRLLLTTVLLAATTQVQARGLLWLPSAYNSEQPFDVGAE
jgi:hypothetical protein